MQIYVHSDMFIKIYYNYIKYFIDILYNFKNKGTIAIKERIVIL